MSPAATIDDTAAEAHVLAAADELFYRRGIAGVSMAEVRDRSGVSMRRLYALHPSKSDLIARWLEHRHVTWMEGFTHRVDTRLAGGDGAVDAIFGALADWMIETDFRGCGFINTHAESSASTDEHRVIIRAHKRSLAEYLESLVPDGALVAVLVDGAIVQASIFCDADPIGRAHRAAVLMTGETP
jgi:AcrR family transcriptional regulator